MKRLETIVVGIGAGDFYRCCHHHRDQRGWKPSLIAMMLETVINYSPARLYPFII